MGLAGALPSQGSISPSYEPVFGLFSDPKVPSSMKPPTCAGVGRAAGPAPGVVALSWQEVRPPTTRQMTILARYRRLHERVSARAP